MSVVELKSDELKGRIIGREGRNIRALETLTGIDFIIDDTPGAVLLSGFDGVRREIARLTLEKLLAGRPHPPGADRGGLRPGEVRDRPAHRRGRRAGGVRGQRRAAAPRADRSCSAGCTSAPATARTCSRHSIECARLAALLAGRAGRETRSVAARAALLHDIGKAVSHEVEGPHALVGGELARRYKEAEAVAHAMEAHHNEVEPQTVEAVIVQIVDALSGARPGARGESLEQLRDAPARARGDREPPRRRGEGLRDARRPRDPRDRAARGDRRRRRHAAVARRSPARSSRSSSTPGRSRSR